MIVITKEEGNPIKYAYKYYKRETHKHTHT